MTHITADGSEKISLDVSVEPDNTSGGASNSIGENGYKRTWNTTVSGGRISVNGQLTDNQMKFSSQTQVITDNGGTVTDGDGKVSVSGASEVTIITSMGTDYKDEYPSYRTGETADELTNRVKWYVDQAKVKTYEELKANHVNDYQNIFNRVTWIWDRPFQKRRQMHFFLHIRQELHQKLKDVSWKSCCSSMEDL